MQKITLIGRLAKDARVIETQNGTKFISFALAANSKSNGVDKTTWYDVRQFNYNEKMAQYFTKGSSLVVIGELDASQEENNGKTYLRLSVLADSIDFNGNSSSSGSGNTQETKVQEQNHPVSNEPVKKTAAKKTEDEETITMGKTKVVEPVDDTSDLPF